MSLEDLEILLRDGVPSVEPLSMGESSDQLESSDLVSTSAPLEPDSPRGWEQLEQRWAKRLLGAGGSMGQASQWYQCLACSRVAVLQTEVVALGTHRDHCERAMLGLLRELLQVRTRLQQQEMELGALQLEVQRSARTPEKEAPQVRGPSGHPSCLLCLV